MNIFNTRRVTKIRVKENVFGGLQARRKKLVNELIKVMLHSRKANK